MPMYFPPIPVYPVGYDSDFTLFLVYNTSETITVADTDAYSEEIPIKPQPGNKPEIWPDNGYATIAGELFYYDAVDKNNNNRVCRFRRCVRNLGGRPTQFNSENTWVRGFVVAEHHSQLADCVLLIENFIGENFSVDYKTLDWRIRHLADTPIISDDFGCSDVEFDFNIVSSSPATGTIATYNIQTQGGAGNFTLQFGDGNSTHSALSGTHVYAPGANIDPVVVMKNDTCQVVQTANIRTNTNTPIETPNTPPFVVPVPIPPPIPPFNVPDINAPTPQMNFPPIMMPAFPGFPSIIEISQLGGISLIEVNPIITVSPHINVDSIDNSMGHRLIPRREREIGKFYSVTSDGIVETPGRIEVDPHIVVSPTINVSTIGRNVNFPSTISIGPFPSMIPIGPFPPVPPIQVQMPIIPPIQVAPAMFPSIVFPSSLPIDITIHTDGSGGMGGGMSLVSGEIIELEQADIQSQPLVNKVEIGEDVILRIANGIGRTFAEVLAEHLNSMIIEPSNYERSVMPLTVPQEISNFDIRPEVIPLEVMPIVRHENLVEEEEVELSPVQIMKAKHLGQETDSVRVRAMPRR